MDDLIEPASLASMPVFASLNKADLQLLQTHLRPHKVRARSALLLLDQPNENVFFVVSGTVKVYIRRASRNELVLNLLGPGEVLGEMSAAEQLPASASAIAVESTTLLFMHGVAFAHCLSKVPLMLSNLLRIQNRRMRRLTTRVEAIATMEVQSRVATQLLIFAQDYGVPADSKKPGVMLPMRLKQSDLGGLIGASREQVNRVLSTYQTKGYLTIDSTYHITLHNLDRLREDCL